METRLLESVLRPVLAALLAGGILFALRVTAARVRHAVWTGVMVTMLITPAWVAWGPKAVWRVLEAAPVPAAVVETAAIAVTPGVDAASAAAPRSESNAWEVALACVYFAGLFGFALRLAVGTVRARRVVREAGNSGGQRSSELCAAPVTIGWLRPVVILTAEWKTWPEAQLQAVLAHEGEHARRLDPLVQWVALVNRAVFWFHPLAWWLEKRISALAEEACDDAVIAGGHDPMEYSACLLELARRVQVAGVRVQTVGMAMPGSHLPYRIRRIASGARAQRVSGMRLVCVGVACTAACAVFTAGALGDAAPAVSLPATAFGAPAPAREVEVPAVKPDAPKKKASQRQVLLAQAVSNASAAAQSITGAVLDPSNAVVPNAQVVLNDSAGAAVATVETNAIGNFAIPDVPAGTYSVSVSVPGFRKLTQTGVVLEAGQTRDVGKMFLQLGTANESVTVTGARTDPPAPAVAPSQAPPRAFVEEFTLPRDAANRPAPPAGAIRVGGIVQALKLLVATRPVYPSEVKKDGVSGTVQIRAVVSKTGVLLGPTVTNQPDRRLAQAALDAVAQWRYQPTLLNGEPVETLASIDVTFQLKD